MVSECPLRRLGCRIMLIAELRWACTQDKLRHPHPHKWVRERLRRRQLQGRRPRANEDRDHLSQLGQPEEWLQRPAQEHVNNAITLGALQTAHWQAVVVVMLSHTRTLTKRFGNTCDRPKCTWSPTQSRSELTACAAQKVGSVAALMSCRFDCRPSTGMLGRWRPPQLPSLPSTGCCLAESATPGAA